MVLFSFPSYRLISVINVPLLPWGGEFVSFSWPRGGEFVVPLKKKKNTNAPEGREGVGIDRCIR